MRAIENIIIVGTGTTALNCAGYCRDIGKKVIFYDVSDNVGILKKRAEAMHISYKCLGKTATYTEISELTEQTFLFSILNDTIVPGYVLDNPNIVAVNCHRALLPKHPGRNAEVWAIYEEDLESGITWHFITEDIDGGDIIKQYVIPLDDKITSYDLFIMQTKEIVSTFPTILEDVISENVDRISQSTMEKQKMHLSGEKPNGGELNKEWSYEKIRSFLRAMDYKGLEVVGKPYIVMDGVMYAWKKYQFAELGDDYAVDTDDIVIEKDGSIIILKDCKVI